ncbi:TonB-dependent receptor domain-containing protein [Sphingobium sp. KCTC 72723]|uniref:TonB-dependent receptor domain-containing protein n=1 Tax=Sphingobium sp. KCTC 72723 TaxID=2733867 RepID=UPI00165EAE1A|nr:TonB-dependent receptor [Sphingobium sp. KCTC 72723]
MKISVQYSCISTIALAMAGIAMPSFAQDAAPAAQAAPAAADDRAPVAGEDIVVTAAAGDKSRFRSSISVSQVSQEAIQNFTPRSEAEVLRSIPGLQPSDTAGPGGNANIGVRGIPVSTGGSEYVALQEDGLPVTLFGDIQFGNNDYWLRFDQNVERVEAVRGGSASTFASQAPGAVVNYLSKTGDKEGGAIGISKGVDFRETRVDFDYGGPISDTLRFHIGGYAREGGGPTNEDFNVLRGYQVKANVTKDFDDGKGYIRLNFKRLDEHAPTNTTMPSLVSIKGNKITDFKPLPTFDARDGSTYSIYNRNFRYVDTNGALQSAEMNGIHPKVTSVGAQFHYELSDMLTVDNNFRYTDMSGSFTTQFLNVAPTAGVLGSTVNGSTVGSIRYAAGPQKGQAYTGTYLNNNPNINTIMKDMGSIANNLALTGKFEMGEAKVTVQAGWFHMSQNIVQDWHVNRQYSALEGENASPLNLFSTTGTQLTSAGQAGFNDNWGNCCARTMDLKYTDDAPFVSANYSGGGLDLDASVRFDRIRGEGTAQAGVAGPNYVVTDEVGTATLPSMLPGGVIERINYKRSYTSWSIGALYAFTNSTSVFARVSRGGRFNADRRVLGGNFNADGSLNAQGASTAVNFLNQQEVGVKHRGFVGESGNYSVEVTGFRSSLTENNYDFTRINNPAPNNDPNISNAYRSWGVEFTGRLNMGNFHLAADLTWVNPKIKDSATAVLAGNRPGGIPKLTYLISPSYDMGLFAVGVSASGQSDAPIDDFNTYTLRGTTFFNAFLKVRPVENLELGLNANNLFDTLGYRAGGSLLPINATSGIFQNSAVYGRTVTAAIRYKF